MKSRRSIAAVLGAGIISVATHVTGLTTAWSTPDVQIEGGAPVTVARLGDSFRDVAIGALPAQEPVDLELTNPIDDVQTPQDPQERIEPVQPDQQTALKTDTQTRSIAPNIRVARLEPHTPVPSSVSVSTPSSLPPLDTVHPAESAVATPSIARAQTVQPQKPTPTKPVKTAALQPLQPSTQAFQADPNADEAAPRLSKRPNKRPREIVQAKVKPNRKPPPKQATKPTPKPTAKAVPKGNGQTAERAGSAQGTVTAKARQAGKKPGKKARQSGNAAASNYPGQVMRKIQRRKPRTNIRGTAIVSFAISADGGLARLALVKSSGSAALDKLALAAIQRAAPFPKPPAGAQRSFRLPVKGR